MKVIDIKDKKKLPKIWNLLWQMDGGDINAVIGCTSKSKSMQTRKRPNSQNPLLFPIIYQNPNYHLAKNPEVNK